MNRYQTLPILGLVLAVVLVAGCTAPHGTGVGTGNGGVPSEGGTLAWCTQENILGSATMPSEYGTMQVLGAIYYQGSTTCHVRYAYSSTDGSMTIDYYFIDELATDYWAVMHISGAGIGSASYTVHIVNEECVAGDCMYW